MGHIVKGFGHVVPAVLLDARAEAAALRAGAQAEVAALRAEARAGREAARREGLEAGRAEGLAEATEAVAAARAEAARLIEGAGPTVIALATKMAEKIIGRAVAIDPGVLADIAGEALATCRVGAAAVRIRLHPDDLAAVESRREVLLGRAPGAALELIADEDIGRNGCVIETSHGRVDARLDTQLAALERALAAGEPPG